MPFFKPKVKTSTPGEALQLFTCNRLAGRSVENLILYCHGGYERKLPSISNASRERKFTVPSWLSIYFYAPHGSETFSSIYKFMRGYYEPYKIYTGSEECFDYTLARMEEYSGSKGYIKQILLDYRNSLDKTDIKRSSRLFDIASPTDFTSVTARIRSELSIPVITSNRINMPDTAEEVLAKGDADLISMARPFLADPEWVNKAEQQHADEINTCIGCNQACLDHVFQLKPVSCLVNPRACDETQLNYLPAKTPKKLAVVGAGPAGLAFATTAASRGHKVTLFEASDRIGGQFNIAKTVPGKEEFNETLRYFQRQIELTGVTLKLNTTVVAEDLDNSDFDDVIVATGVTPRTPDIEGIDHPKVLSYLEAFQGAEVGKTVAIIGAGGIGFDLSEFLTQNGPSTSLDPAAFMEEWGVDLEVKHRGGLVSGHETETPARKVYLLQRKSQKPGSNLGKTTGWIHRSTLARRGVKMLHSCEYEKIDDQGLHIKVEGRLEILPVDHVILCAGQEPLRTLADSITYKPVHLIGGADVAAELDAKRAINQGCHLAAAI